MLSVIGASLRGMRDVGGERLAELEVRTADPAAPELVACFRSGPKGYQLVRVFANRAQTEIDWYDNNLHEAFEDVTMTLFSGPGHAGPNDRKAFAGQVLALPGVRESLDRQYGGK